MSVRICDNIELVDVGLRVGDHLVVGDLQIGYEESLNKQGVLVPRQQMDAMVHRLDAILDRVRVKTIVLNGDVKHEFGTISRQEWRDVTRVLTHLVEKGYKVVVVKGNHDLMLGPIVNKLHVEIVPYYRIGDVVVMHGDRILPVVGETIVIGHEHPAVSFRERPEERYKCFLVGTWHGKRLIVMPSLNTLTVGSDVTKEKMLSPFLQQGIDAFDVYVVEDRVYTFGKLALLK